MKKTTWREGKQIWLPPSRQIRTLRLYVQLRAIILNVCENSQQAPTKPTRKTKRD